MPRTFRPGQRLTRIQITAYIFLSLEILFFYLVYLYVLHDSYVEWAGARLIAIFVFLEALVIVLTKKFFQKYREKIYTVLDEKGVTIHNFFGEYTMLWEDFEGIDHLRIAGRHPCPITFVVKGKMYTPNAYLQDLSIMDKLIIDRIRHRVPVPDDIDRALQSYRIMKV